MSVTEEIKAKFRNGDALVRLLFVNAALFVIITLYLLILHLGHTLPPSWLGGDLRLMASYDMREMLYRPWSLITHMFLHIDFWHFLFNMVALYVMGQFFTTIQGSKRLLALYIMGGLSGFFLFALSYNIFEALRIDSGKHILGASAAVMAITVATAVLDPKRIIHVFGVIRIELLWFAGILVLLDVASVRLGENSGGHIGHIGGAAFGFIYARQLQKGNDMGRWLDRLIEKMRSVFSRKKMTVAANNGRPKSDEQFNLEKKARQKKIDEILDRISRSGYESLSRDEKEFLFKNSQK